MKASVPPLHRQDDPASANDYLPDNVLDDDLRTAWVEGVGGRGTGSRLTFTFARRIRLTELQIVNGYAKSTAVQLDNGAARLIELTSDGTREPVRRHLARDARRQTIAASFGTTRRVRLEIVSAYRGDRFDDVAISEVWFKQRR